MWDSNDNFRTIRERVQALLTGCKCVTGCKNGRCGCVKKKRLCTEGCDCQNCQNMDTTSTPHVATTEEHTIDETTMAELEEMQDELEEDVADIVDLVFRDADESRHFQEYDSSDFTPTDCSETEEEEEQYT